MKNPEDSQDADPFTLENTFPESAAVFTFRVPSFELARKAGIVVLDTNALLLPYRVGNDSLKKIRSTLPQLVTSYGQTTSQLLLWVSRQIAPFGSKDSFIDSL